MVRKARAFPGSTAEPVAEHEGAHVLLEMRGSSDDPYWQELYTEMLRSHLGLFAKEILGLVVGPHLNDWSELAETQRRIAINAARDHSKSTFWSYAYPIWRAWGDPGKEIYVFSATLDQAMEFLDIIIYGRDNLKGMLELDELRHLVPSKEEVARDPRLRLNRQDVRFKNGSRIRAIGYGKKTRGRHPKYIVLDDVLNDEDMFSETVRRKNIEYYKSAIVNMAAPDGQIVNVGCVTEDAWVPTEVGLRRIGDLRPASRDAQTLSDLDLRVAGRQGLKTATKFWDNGYCPTKLVTLQTGHRIEGSYRHPLLQMGAQGYPVWSRMDELAVGDWVALRLGTECWGAEQGLDEDTAYLLGLWTAEGSSEPPYRLTIANTDSEIHDFLRARPERWLPHRDGSHWRCSSKELLEQWEQWGVRWVTSEAKRVPDAVMQGSRANAVAWLQGYLDGDGNSYLKGSIAQVMAGSVSEGLLDDVQVLLGNLGILTRKTSRESKPTKRATNGGRRLYLLRALGDDARELMRWGFRLSRKRKYEDLHGTALLVPQQQRLIRAAMDSKPKRASVPGAPHTKPPFNAGSVVRASSVRADTLYAMASWYERHGADVSACSQLRANASEGLHWVQVASVEDSEAYTVDFVVPDGHSFVSNGILSHNTPYHMADLWGWFRKNPVYTFKRYPGIIKENGEERALFPWRWTLKSLYGKKAEIGSVAFTREILCQPISDDLSIFPSFLFPPLFSKHMTLRPSKQTITDNGWTTYMGVDVARSATVGADYFVIFVIAADDEDNHYVVDIIRNKGWPFKRQLELIERVARQYDVSLCFIESNVMQQVWTDEMIRTTDVPVKAFQTTAVNKYPLDKGVPGLRILLENEKLVIPRGDEYSRAQTDIWIEECTMFGFVDGKLQGAGEHDDTVMAWWFASEAKKQGGFRFAMGDEDGEEANDWGDGGPEGEGWEDVLLGNADAGDSASL